jgi:hypothetical protein
MGKGIPDEILTGLKKVTISKILDLDFPKPTEEAEGAEEPTSPTSKSNKFKCNKCTFSCKSNATLSLHKLFHSDTVIYFSEIDSLMTTQLEIWRVNKFETSLNTLDTLFLTCQYTLFLFLCDRGVFEREKNNIQNERIQFLSNQFSFEPVKIQKKTGRISSEKMSWLLFYLNKLKFVVKY